MAIQSINTLKNWFKRGFKPLQQQFWDWMDSYWHKDEVIPVNKVDQLETLLNTLYSTKAPLSADGKIPIDLIPQVTDTFKQGGNSFGTAATLGTLDNYPLSLKTNGVERLRVTSDGTIETAGDAHVSGKLSVNTGNVLNNSLYTYMSNWGGSAGYVGFGFANTPSPALSDSVFDIYQGPAIAPAHLFSFKHILADNTGGGHSYSIIDISTGINQTNGSNGVIRGIYYNPAITALNGEHRAIETVTGNVLLGTTTGNTLIGTSIDSGFKLDVNGPARLQGNATLNSGLLYFGPETGPSSTKLRIIQKTGHSAFPGIEIGSLNTDISSFTAPVIVIGGLNSYPNNPYLQLIGQENSIADGSGHTVIGTSNKINTANAVNGAVSNHILIGFGNTGNSYTNNQLASIVMGCNNDTNGYTGGGLFGSKLKYYNHRQLAFGHNSTNVDFSIKDVYIGYGVRNEWTADDNSGNQGHGPDISINPSWAADAIDKNGGNITIAGGRGTGAGTPGSIIFSTAGTTTSSGTLQSLVQRAKITPEGDLELLTAANGVVLKSPNGTRYKLTVADNGSLVTTAL